MEQLTEKLFAAGILALVGDVWAAIDGAVETNCAAAAALGYTDFDNNLSSSWGHAFGRRQTIVVLFLGNDGRGGAVVRRAGFEG